MANVHFGFQKILFKRFSYIILWHVGIVTLTLRLVASINTLEDFFTLSWIKNLFVSNTLAVALFQLFLSAVFIVTESKQYLRVEQYDNVSRFQYICQKLSPNNCLWFFVYFLRGIVSSIVFFVALKNFFVNSTSSNDSNQVTESIIILINDAVGINFLFFLYESVYQKSFKYFSLVQNNQSIIIPKIVIAAKDVSLKSFYYCIIYTVFYLLNGHSVCSFFCYLFSVKCNLSYATILDPFVLYCLWLLNAFILFNHLILKLLFDLFLTSRIDFLINIDSIDKDVPFTLKEALATHNVPLLQYLGFYDLNIISQFDGARRKQIFSLSYPGGHPHVWKSISQEAVKLILETNSQLEAITLPPKPKPPEMAAKYSTADEVYFKMRSLSQSHFLQEKMPAENYVDISSKIANFLKTIRPVSFMLEELKEKQLVSALQHYQALSLACYSMANLASASMAEDRFGIVQQDLSVIINALLKLYVTLNKLVVVVNRKPNSSILQIKKHLVHVVKSSLYKLAIDFGPYVKDLSLPAEDEKLFTNFILFKN